MNYKDLIKKYWFVCLIGIVLVVFIGIYAVDAYNNRELTVSSKQVDGNYAVYSVDGEYVYADDFFDSLYDTNGLECAFVQYQRQVLNAAYETTDDISELASNYAAYIYQYYGEEAVVSDLKSMGYTNGTDDLIQYYIDAQKQQLLINDYVDANWDTLYPDYETQENPMVVAQILIKVEDITSNTDDDGNTTYTANPTEEETEKLNAVLEALENGEDFFDVQEEYNEDGSNTTYLITTSEESGYYPIFVTTSRSLSEGEVSEPAVSSVGYHIIKNLGSSKEELTANSDFLESLETVYTSLNLKAVQEKAAELGYELVDEELVELVNNQLESEAE